MFEWGIRLLRRTTSIQSRIYCFTIGLLVLFYATFFYLFIGQLNDLKQEKLQSLEFLVSNIITEAASQALWRGNPTQLTAFVTAVIESTAIVQITVLDDREQIFLSKGSTDLIEALDTVTSPIFRNRLAPDFSQLDADSQSVVGIRESVGFVRVQIDKTQLLHTVWHSFLTRSYPFFIVMILILPVTYILVRSLIKPLQAIMAELARFERGDYGGEPTEAGLNDEYARVSEALHEAGQSIQRKTAQIEAANGELRRYSRTLEHQVQEAIEARRAADEANQHQEVFVNNIAHELKRPLAGINAVLQLLEDDLFEMAAEIDDVDPGNGTLEPARIQWRETIFQLTRCIETARFASTEIGDMVGDVIASVQSKDERIVIRLRPTQLKQSMIQLMASHQARAQRKGLEFSISCDEADDVWANTDWVRVAQVINALIDNAIKFTTHGAVSVLIRTLVTTDHVSLAIAVEDTGIGMLARERDYLFQLLSAEPGVTVKPGTGIGTGLIIAKRVADKLQGQLALKSSVPQRGTCFTFDCRFARSLAADHDLPMLPLIGAMPAAAELNAGVRINVLYLEDSAINQMIFRGYCTRAELSLTIVSRGAEAYDKYFRGHFDVLVVDCSMPLGDGYELVRRVRTHELGKQGDPILIFALTADLSAANRQRCLARGFDAILPQPYTDQTHRYFLDTIAKRQQEPALN